MPRSPSTGCSSTRAMFLWSTIRAKLGLDKPIPAGVARSYPAGPRENGRLYWDTFYAQPRPVPGQQVPDALLSDTDPDFDASPSELTRSLLKVAPIPGFRCDSCPILPSHSCGFTSLFLLIVSFRISLNCSRISCSIKTFPTAGGIQILYHSFSQDISLSLEPPQEVTYSL